MYIYIIYKTEKTLFLKEEIICTVNNCLDVCYVTLVSRRKLRYVSGKCGKEVRELKMHEMLIKVGLYQI